MLAKNQRDHYTESIGDALSPYYKIGDVSKICNGAYVIGLFATYEYLKQLSKRNQNNIIAKDADAIRQQLVALGFLFLKTEEEIIAHRIYKYILQKGYVYETDVVTAFEHIYGIDTVMIAINILKVNGKIENKPVMGNDGILESRKRFTEKIEDNTPKELSKYTLLKYFLENHDYELDDLFIVTFGKFGGSRAVGELVRILEEEDMVQWMWRYEGHIKTPYVEITEKGRKYIEENNTVKVIT